ncbi:hypothetical protein ONZ45_g9922 [Pleurotus djamor]|nr:hypothetical protein ONZ45_g9922 [Pleurotus djamor]
MVNTSFSGIPRAGSSNLAAGTTSGPRAIIFSMTAVILGLGGFYAHLNRKQNKKVELGTNAHHEQRIASLGRADQLTHARLQTLTEDKRDLPLSRPTMEHNSGHVTIGSKDAKGYLAGQPTPQRDRGDGMAYTKKM